MSTVEERLIVCDKCYEEVEMPIGRRLCYECGYEVIGIVDRPITLTDVLRAIEKTERPDSDGEIQYSVYGELFHIGKYASLGRNGEYTKAFWNLTTDLDGQSEETKAFIFRILGV